MKIPRSVHGGEYSSGKGKTKRPLSSTNSHHVVFRASAEVPSFLSKSRRAFIIGQIQKWSIYFKVRIYAMSINSNHIHLVVYSKDLQALKNFWRVLPGQLAQRLGTGIKKFWMHLVFTRIVTWGRAFKAVLRYVEKNTLEAAGLIRYVPRRKIFLKHTVCFKEK